MRIVMEILQPHEWNMEQEFDVSVISLEDAYPNVFRIIVTDNESNSTTSRWYKVIADDDCERQYRDVEQDQHVADWL